MPRALNHGLINPLISVDCTTVCVQNEKLCKAQIDKENYFFFQCDIEITNKTRDMVPCSSFNV